MKLKRHLFNRTSHSPSLIELVGYDRAKEITDFCFIANPYYPTKEMMDHLREWLPTLIKSYPSSDPYQGQYYLSQVLNVNPEHLIIGNGATELITVMCRMLIERIGISVPTFSEYIERLRDEHQAELYYLKPENDYQLDLQNFHSWIRQKRLRAALIINPANPTGQTFSTKEMMEFLDSTKHLELVVLDESFIDFANEEIPSLLPFADSYSNLVIVRSMSKHCGVPGLRLGYLYTSNLYLLNRIRQAIPTWNLNSLAEYYLSMLPETNNDYHEARIKLIGEIRWLFNELSQLKAFKPYPTGANFILLRINNGLTSTELQNVLLENYNLYVRDNSNKIGMDAFHIRIASQGREKDMKIVEALKELSEPHSSKEKAISTP